MLVTKKLIPFSKRSKNMSIKQEIVSDATFRAWPFSSDFSFAYKDGWVSAATCKYYCPLVVNCTITSCCKEFHLICSRFPSSVFENVAMVLCENQSFFLLFRNVATFIESHCVFLCYFLQYDQVFLISFLDVCYHYLVLWIQSMLVQSQNYL